MTLPMRVQEPGSSDTYTLQRYVASGDHAELVNYLDACFPLFWKHCNALEQKKEWRAECVRCEDGVVIVTRHTTSGNNLIGAALARRTEFEHEAHLVANSASYDAEKLAPLQLEALRLECARMGLVLGRAETKRIWVAL